VEKVIMLCKEMG
jgi:hypothetical protein